MSGVPGTNEWPKILYRWSFCVVELEVKPSTESSRQQCSCKGMEMSALFDSFCIVHTGAAMP